MHSTLETELKASETRRCAAMLSGDIAALAGVLDPRLQFHHATGAVDDKTGLLAKMAAGRIAYLGIDWSEERVISLAPDAAVLTGRMLTRVRVEGVEKALDNRVITVWSRTAGDWLLVAFQSTPIAAPN